MDAYMTLAAASCSWSADNARSSFMQSGKNVVDREVHRSGSVVPRGVRARAPYAEYSRNVCLRNAMVAMTVEVMRRRWCWCK